MSKKNKTNAKTPKALLEKILKDRKLRANIVRDSFTWFFAVYFGHYMEYETAPFHEELFRIAEDESIPLAVIASFRGSAKSTIITTAYVLWAIMGRQQKKYPAILSQTEHKAREHLMNIKRELEGNGILRSDLGPFKEESDTWGAQALFIPKFKAQIRIGSVEQNLRGARQGEFRPDLIILDDAEDTRSVKTQEGRDKTFDWFTGEVIPLGDKGTRCIVIGNLLHEDSLLKRLQFQIQEGLTDGVYVEFPVVDEEGNPLWPGKYPTKEDVEKEKRKLMNPIAWMREYMLTIVADEDSPIRREWIKTYDGLPPLQFHGYHATGVDLAISKKKTADYTAMVSARVVGQGEHLRIYILPNPVQERLTSSETIQRAKGVAVALGSHRFYAEDVGWQRAFVEQMCRENFSAKGVRPYGDKYARLAYVAFLVQDGKVLFPKVGAEDLIRNLVSFGSEKYDDLADAFAILLSQIIEENRGSSVMAIRWSVEPGELNHLNSRQKMIELEKREHNASFFKIGRVEKKEPYDHVVGNISYLRGVLG